MTSTHTPTVRGRRNIRVIHSASVILAIAGCGTEAAEGSSATRPPLPTPDQIAKLPKDGGPKYNRLIFEKSPYLLQHAANPVDWYPWGEEAFEAARREDKPVFLSVGYSTCHWCHVMERESFENEQVAALMNKHFISVKVDREERPDIDTVYMEVTQRMTGSGGWPMTVVMTPDKVPYFAATYIPKDSGLNRPGMMRIVPRLGEVWKTERDQVNAFAKNIVAELEQSNAPQAGKGLDAATLDTAFQQFDASHDASHGGFGRAPKFPTPHTLSFLLRYHKRTGNARALAMVEKTLTAMRLGGVYDQVGFGTHRYSTDAVWLLPHFEKMLYDQALLAIASVEAFQVTGKPLYAQTAKEIFTYVLRDMTSPEGGFYSAEDADSEGEEGKFYVWEPKELHEILGSQEADLYIKVFHITEGGNFVDQATRRKTGDSIPHLKKPLGQVAAELKLNEADLRGRLEASRRKLFDVRERRIHPLKDDKILTDWNGLMIAAMARGGQALGEPKYIAAAKSATDFLLAKLHRSDGRLFKRYRQNEAGLTGHLEDYAFVVMGLLDLYEATFEVRYLQEAIALNDTMLAHFWDQKEGGLFMTADDAERLLIRSKKIYDGAIPSGNSVAALNLLRIGRMTAEPTYDAKAEAIMKAFSSQVAQFPSGHSQLLIAVDFACGPSLEIVVSGKPDAEDTAQMLGALRRPFIPNKVVLLRPDGQDAGPIGKIAPYTEMQTSRGGAATAYVCQNFVCKLPTTDVQVMLGSMQPQE